MTSMLLFAPFMLKQLFQTKSLDALLVESEAPQHQLKRTLGAFDVVMLGIGAIIGAGIFATIGTAAAGDATRPGAGPALILSFVLTARRLRLRRAVLRRVRGDGADLRQRLHLLPTPRSASWSPGSSAGT